MLVNLEVSDYGNKKEEITDYGVFDEQNNIEQTLCEMNGLDIKRYSR